MVKIMPNTLHSIQNIGTEEMYLVIIANEVFDKNDADTFYI
jgi:quercetin dioxygenase-like cupin family protein